MINSHRFIYCKFLILVFLFICVSISKIQSQSLPPWPPDDDDHEKCPQFESRNTIRSVILVDASSEIPDEIIFIAQNDIARLILSAQYNHPLEVYITKLRNHDQSSTTIFLERPVVRLASDIRPLKCSPDCGIFDDCITRIGYNKISNDYRRHVENLETEFQDHLIDLMKTQPRDDSPILQTLKSIDYLVDDEIIDQLFIVSDMLENSSLIDVYDSAMPNFESAKNEIKRGVGFPEKIQTSTVFLLNRCGDEGEIQQSAQFISFWNDYFSYIGDSQPIWEDIPSGPCE